MIALLFAALLQGPEIPRLPPIRRDPQITYLDRSGAVIGVRGGKFAPPVDLARLPKYVPAAFVAIEDRRFYEHSGFDAVGIARAVVRDLTKGRAAQGASTITQQLARNLFLSSDRTLERKAEELVYAVELEQTYTKAEILGLYLSRVYFGAGAYGIEAASQRYFNIPASRLSLRQAAALAALMKSPTNYSPIEHRDRSDERATLVLDAMVETGAITPAERAKALKSSFKVYAEAPTAPAQYFVDWIDGQTRALVGAPTKDLVVDTTLDLPLETVAAEVARDTATRYAKQRVEQAAVVTLDGDGRVRALLGGIDYSKSPYDRAVDAHRQPGSAWKPFVYLTALEAGRTPDTAVVDEPVTIDGWSPANFEPEFLGQITLERALALSVNTVAARLADEVGRPKVAETAKRLGIRSQINLDPAMALGTTTVSPLEMAEAYGAFSTGGRRVYAYGIERIRSSGGQVVFQHRQDARPEVINSPPLAELLQMMRSVIAYGTGARAAIPGADLAGKTGTASEYRDAWFCGVTGNLATVVWVGRDDNKPMIRLTGGSAPTEIWRGVMKAAMQRLPATPLSNGTAPPPQPVATPTADASSPATASGQPPNPTPTPTPVAPQPDRQPEHLIEPKAR